jgi:hypothetical protein
VTSALIVEQLDRRLAGHRDLPPLDEAEEYLLRHMLVGARLLPGAAARYRALRGRWESEGTSEALRAEALDAAGDIAAVLQGARRERERALALRATPLKPTQLLGALSQIFDSLVLLTSTDAAEAGLSLSADQLDVLLAMKSLQVWLDPESSVLQGFVLD